MQTAKCDKPWNKTSKTTLDSIEAEIKRPLLTSGEPSSQQTFGLV